MTAIKTAVKFDQVLWDARSEGNRSDEGDANPYLATSAKWAAWEAGRAFGLGRISQARGQAMNVQTDRAIYRVSFEELAQAPRRVMSITYLHGATR